MPKQKIKSLKWNIWQKFVLLLIILIAGYTYINYHQSRQRIEDTSQKELLRIATTLSVLITPEMLEDTIGLEREEIFDVEALKGLPKASGHGHKQKRLKPTKDAPEEFLAIYNVLVKVRQANALDSDIYILMPNEEFSIEDYQDAYKNFDNALFWEEKRWEDTEDEVDPKFVDGKNYRKHKGKLQARRLTVKDAGVVFSVSTKVQDYANYFPVNKAMLEAILFKKATTLPIYTDPEGSWVSAIIPIILDDEVLGLVETDFELGHLLRQQQKQAIIFGTAGCLITLLFSVIIYLVAGKIASKATILKDQLVNYSAGNTEVPIQIDAEDEIGAIASVAENMRQEVNHRIEEIEKKNAVILEQEAKIQSFLSNVLENYPGLLFVMDDQGNIGEYKSGRVNSIYGDVDGKKLPEVIYQGNKSAVDGYYDVLKISTASSATCEGFMKDLTDSRLVVGETVYDLSYYVSSEKEDGTVDGMLMLGKDITQQIKEEQKAKEAGREATLISTVAKDLSGFQNFMIEATKIIEKVLSDIRPISAEMIDELYRQIHTIKGSSSAYHIYKVESIAHTLESNLSEVRTMVSNDSESELSNEWSDKFWEDCKTLQTQISDEHTRLSELFNLKEGMISISRDDFERVAAMNLPVDQAFDTLALPTLNSFVDKLVEQGLNAAQASLMNQGIYKEFIHEVTLDDSTLPSKGQSLLSNVLNHMIRNAADHAIEAMEEREVLGKTPEGKISIQQSVEGENIRLDMVDDGAGIHRDRVVEIARDAGIIGDEELSYDDVCELIFHPNFSTKSEVSDLSGRGVGMDAVRAFLTDVGGEIRVKSEEGKGSTFTLTIPRDALS